MGPWNWFVRTLRDHHAWLESVLKMFDYEEKVSWELEKNTWLQRGGFMVVVIIFQTGQGWTCWNVNENCQWKKNKHGLTSVPTSRFPFLCLSWLILANFSKTQSTLNYLLQLLVWSHVYWCPFWYLKCLFTFLALKVPVNFRWHFNGSFPFRFPWGQDLELISCLFLFHTLAM